MILSELAEMFYPFQRVMVHELSDEGDSGYSVVYEGVCSDIPESMGNGGDVDAVNITNEDGILLHVYVTPIWLT